MPTQCTCFNNKQKNDCFGAYVWRHLTFKLETKAKIFCFLRFERELMTSLKHCHCSKWSSQKNKIIIARQTSFNYEKKYIRQKNPPQQNSLEACCTRHALCTPPQCCCVDEGAFQNTPPGRTSKKKTHPGRLSRRQTCSNCNEQVEPLKRVHSRLDTWLTRLWGRAPPGST